MTRDEQNFMDWCLRNNIPWPGTSSAMCMAWVSAAREERGACAKLAEDSTAFTQFQTREHYKLAYAISAAIRSRGQE